MDEISSNGVKKKSEVSLESEELELEAIHDVKEQIFGAVGNFGKWQLLKCIYIVAVIWLPGSFHLLNMVFFRAETRHWCSRPESLSNISAQDWTSLSSPLLDEAKWSKYGNHDSCHIYDIDFEKLYTDYDGNTSSFTESEEYQTAVKNNVLRSCEAWEYDKSFWRRTIIQEWDLVCDRKPLRKLTQQVTFFGLLCGAFISGVLSDRFGRVPTMLGLTISNVIFGTVSAFSPYYELFLVCVWVCGFACIGFGTVAYCWMMELLTGREKTIFGCAPHFNFAFGGLVVAGIAYLIPDWHQMQLVFSLPLLILLGTYWVLPESPRWLLTHDRIDEAEKILRDAAKFNGKPLPDNFKLHPIQHHTPDHGDHHKHHHHHGSGKGYLGFLELFKTPNLRKKTLIVYYLWFATSIVYYGLTLNSNDFGASLFTYFSVGKAIEFPSIMIVTILVLKTGRRISVMILFAACGLSLLGTIFITPGQYPYEWPIVALNIFGRGSSIGALCICYVYSAEIFPTVIRNVGIGSSSVWARIGPMLAPYVADLSKYEPRLPIVIFGCFALLASFLVTFLPETAHHKLPDTIAEGEMMGQGDTIYSAILKSCRNRKKKNKSMEDGIEITRL